MGNYRNEWKYECELKDTIVLIERLKSIMEFDKNGKKGKYMVHTLYFDDYYNSCMNDNEIGIAKRFKYRIRFYNDSSNLYLEYKTKEKGMCNKISTPLTLDEYYAILNNNYNFLLWKTDKPLIVKFAKEMMTREFKPKIITDYERLALVNPLLKIRITIDSHITVANDVKHFLDSKYVRYPMQKENLGILEIKYAYILPSFIKQQFSKNYMIKQKYSKYYLGRLKMKEGEI